MLLSEPVEYSWISTLGYWMVMLLAFAGILYLAWSLLVFFKVAEMPEGLKKFGKGKFGLISTGVYFGLLLLAFLLYFLAPGDQAAFKQLRKEITTQASTVYGIELSEESADHFAEFALEVVGSETTSTAASTVILDSERALVLQVSSNGSAKLLEAPLVFTEPHRVREELLEFESTEVEEEFVEVE